MDIKIPTMQTSDGSLVPDKCLRVAFREGVSSNFVPLCVVKDMGRCYYWDGKCMAVDGIVEEGVMVVW